MKRLAIYSPSASEALGHPTYAIKICSRLAQKYDLTLYTLTNKSINQILINHNIPIQLTDRFPPGYALSSTYSAFGKLAKIIASLRFLYMSFILLSKFYKKNQNADLYHLFEFEYISAFVYFFFHRQKLSKSVLSFHTAGFKWMPQRPIIHNLYKGFIIPKAVKWLVHNAKCSTANSEYQKEELLKELDLPENSEKVMHSGWGNDHEVNLLKKEEACAQLNLHPDQVYGLFFGVIRRSKGFEELVNHLKDTEGSVSLIIAGAPWDYDREEIERIIEKSGINTRIIPHIRYIKDEEIPYFYSASDFVFLTHKSEHQGFSGPLSLSVQYQRPVVASDIGQIGSFVKNFDIGCIFACENWHDFVDQTNLMVSRIKNSYYTYENFEAPLLYNSWDTIANRIHKIYNL